MDALQRSRMTAEQASDYAKTMRKPYFKLDTRLLGGYYCNGRNCKQMYINIYRDPCWQPNKRYGRPAR